MKKTKQSRISLWILIIGLVVGMVAPAALAVQAVTSETSETPSGTSAVVEELPTPTEAEGMDTPTSADTAEIEAYLLEAVDNSFSGSQAWNSSNFFPISGQDKNANDVVKEMMADKGYTGIEVSVKTPDSREEYNAGVDADGTIHFIDRDFATMSSGMHSVQLQTEYTLTKDGVSKDFLIKTQVAWDPESIKRQMAEHEVTEAQVRGTNVSFDEMTSSVTIAKPSASWFNIETPKWIPDIAGNRAVSVSGYLAPYTLNFSQSYLTVTGELEFRQYVGYAKVATSRTSAGLDFYYSTSRYRITIPAREDARTLQQILNPYRATQIKLFGTTTTAPLSTTGKMVASDLQFATSRDLNTDLKNKTLEIISSEPNVIRPQMYRGYVYRPLPGGEPVEVTLTAKLTDNDTGEFATKVIGTYTVEPLTLEELESAQSLMEDALASYPAGILGSQNSDPNEIESSLASFQEVRYAANGTELEWIRSYQDRSDKHVAPTALEGSEGQEAYRLFKSSRPDLIAHESLRLVSKPKYDTTVTIESALTHQTFAKYAATLDPTDHSKAAQIIRSLVYRPVTATLKVLGESGADPDEGFVRGTFQVIGSSPIKEAADHASAHREWYTESFRVPAGTSLMELTEQLLNRPEEGFYLKAPYGFLESITVPGMGTNTYQITNGVGSSWLWYYLDGEGNRQVGEVMAGSYILQANDVVIWEFMNDPTYPYGVAQESPEEPIDLVETPDHWTNFGKDSNNNALYETDAITVPAKEASWHTQVGEKDEWGTSYNSDLLVIGDTIFVANANKLYKLDKAGHILETTDLRTSIGYFARLAYANGMVVVPLQGGALQAVNAQNMQTQWVADTQKYVTWEPVVPGDFSGEWQPVYFDVQNNSSTLIADGYVYSATMASIDPNTTGGLLRSVNMATGQTRWMRDIPGGFYWSGAVKSGNALLIAGEDGLLLAIDEATGKDITSLNINEKVRSTLVKQGDLFYFTDLAGHFYQVAYDATLGRFGTLQKVKFSTRSTSTPAIYDGKAYVGSSSGFHVIDLATMTVLATYETQGPVQATPLVVARPADSGSGAAGSEVAGSEVAGSDVSGSTGQVFVYFTENASKGRVLVYDGKEVSTAFQPPADAQNYTTSSVVIGQDGTLYYTNDSGVLFGLVSTKAAAPTDPTTSETTEPTTSETTGQTTEATDPNETNESETSEPTTTPTTVDSTSPSSPTSTTSPTSPSESPTTPSPQTSGTSPTGTSESDVPKTGEAPTDTTIATAVALLFMAAILVILKRRKTDR